MKGIGSRVSLWLSLLGGICMGVAGTGCKHEDRESPAVALSAPKDGFSIMADSAFTISGIANDDRGLSSVTATLYESVTEVVVKSKTIDVSGVRSNFSMDLEAGDRYTATGDYTLRVTALDGAGNLGAAFTQVHIQALPLSYRGAVWMGDDGFGNYAVHALDTSGLVRSGPSGLPQVADMLVDNRNGQLVAVQSTPGWLRAWDLVGLDPVFQVDLPQGTGTTTYQALAMNRLRYYTGLAVPSYVRSYRFDGAPVSDFSDALHPATAIYAAADRVYVALQGVLGSPLKLDAYEASSNALLSTYLLDWPASVIAPIGEDRLLVGGNLSGAGRLLVLDRLTMSPLQELPLTDALIGAATAGERAWVLSTSGLYEFYPATGTLSGLLVVGSYGAIAVDATLDRVFLGGAGTVELRSGAGALLQTYAGGFGAVKFIDIRYNK